jgi:hypothetical protein
MPAPDRLSRYRFSFLAKDVEGRSFLTEPPKYGYRAFSDNVQHVVQAGDTLTSIAGRYYASIQFGELLGWLIADFQPEPIHDPTLAPEMGSVIIVPSVRTVREEILSERRRKAGVLQTPA